MANKLVAAQGTLAGEEIPEGLMLKANNIWSSPPGGWMIHQSGKWVQMSIAGVALQSAAGAPNIFMAGMIFDSVTQGATGELRDAGSGKVGTWKVIGVSR